LIAAWIASGVTLTTTAAVSRRLQARVHTRTRAHSANRLPVHLLRRVMRPRYRAAFVIRAIVSGTLLLRRAAGQL
jgi:hypothetical protein